MKWHPNRINSNMRKTGENIKSSFRVAPIYTNKITEEGVYV